eukprot:CAMPEP_0195538400 /NCGR_PEP_ID=MMETSP0794_2-20130614/49509_1 /TAXON_ID=515487 /ORGANISM="Stephanopyxis turris, Strain CCMP 815" /LENGTH=62 /DNA_ID=CAMNT_0040672375 /DNA_START=812 /DNA_END=997 /DNA_ORIENTATION=+
MNRKLGEGFVFDTNGVRSKLLCDVKYTEVWGNQLHKNISIGSITALTVGNEFNRESVAKVRN